MGETMEIRRFQWNRRKASIREFHMLTEHLNDSLAPASSRSTADLFPWFSPRSCDSRYERQGSLRFHSTVPALEHQLSQPVTHCRETALEMVKLTRYNRSTSLSSSSAWTSSPVSTSVSVSPVVVTLPRSTPSVRPSPRP